MSVMIQFVISACSFVSLISADCVCKPPDTFCPEGADESNVAEIPTRCRNETVQVFWMSIHCLHNTTHFFPNLKTISVKGDCGCFCSQHISKVNGCNCSSPVTPMPTPPPSPQGPDRLAMEIGIPAGVLFLFGSVLTVALVLRKRCNRNYTQLNEDETPV